MLGLKTAIIEKDPFLGGTCLHRGCIPTKALLHTAHLYDEFKHAGDHGLTVGKLGVDFPKVHQRKAGIVDKLAKGVQFLIKKRKVEVFTGMGRIVDAGSISITSDKGEERIRADAIILATGSVPASLPHIQPDQKTIVDSDGILIDEKIPKSLAVIGAGAVGVEFASIFNSFGTKVTIIELLPNVVPIEDSDISTALEKAFKKKGIDIHTSSEVKAVKTTSKGATLTIESNGKTSELVVEKVLSSIGRKPVTQDIGIGSLGITTDKRGYLDVNEFMQTKTPNIYAIGDIVNTPWLAHVASAEGILAVDHIAGKEARPIDYDKIPNCTYCSPEVASVGLTERAAKERGYNVKVGQFPFSAIGKAMIMGETDGFIKMVTEDKYGEVLGVHIIGPKATELIGEACLGLSMETVGEEIAKTVHPHPTLSEAMMEAAHSVYGEAIHF
jgi:dihydrolipoamide dehydrogenase